VITFGRAARLRRFVTLLARGPLRRGEILSELGFGLRTFYRELDFVRACGIKVGLKNGAYSLRTPTATAEGQLPFPDPHLSFAEVAELARCSGGAGRRLAELLARVLHHPGAKARAAVPRRPKGDARPAR
jgi:predicted DNA-binding transcriptional regulator YafY